MVQMVRFKVKECQYFEGVHAWNKVKQGTFFEQKRKEKIVARLLLFAGCNIVYSILGALVFIEFEKWGFAQKQDTMLQEKERLVHKLERSNSFSDKYSNASTRVDYMRKVFDLRCKLDGHETWTYHTATHFAYSIVTTIGFGDKTATTTLGKLYTMIYAVVGIILIVMCLGMLRWILVDGIRWVLAQLPRSRRIRIYEAHMKVTFIIFLSVALLVIPAVIISYDVEGDGSGGNFLLILYGTLIAVTTIGFGDEVVLDDFHESNIGDQTWAQGLYMLIIFAILVLISAIFELIKQKEVENMSRRISTAVNRLHEVDPAAAARQRWDQATALVKTRMESSKMGDSNGGQNLRHAVNVIQSWQQYEYQKVDQTPTTSGTDVSNNPLPELEARDSLGSIQSDCEAETNGQYSKCSLSPVSSKVSKWSKAKGNSYNS